MMLREKKTVSEGFMFMKVLGIHLIHKILNDQPIDVLSESMNWLI